MSGSECFSPADYRLPNPRDSASHSVGAIQRDGIRLASCWCNGHVVLAACPQWNWARTRVGLARQRSDSCHAPRKGMISLDVVLTAGDCLFVESDVGTCQAVSSCGRHSPQPDDAGGPAPQGMVAPRVPSCHCHIHRHPDTLALVAKQYLLDFGRSLYSSRPFASDYLVVYLCNSIYASTSIVSTSDLQKPCAAPRVPY